MQLVKARARFPCPIVTSAYITAGLRRQVRRRARDRCEYCLLAEQNVFFPHEPDHIIAEKHGGTTTAENLALSCFDCNRFKGSDIASLDPINGSLVPLFNPRTDDWEEHFQIEGGNIFALTAVGRATERLLKLNLPVRVEIRATLAQAADSPDNRSAQKMFERNMGEKKIEDWNTRHLFARAERRAESHALRSLLSALCSSSSHLVSSDLRFPRPHPTPILTVLGKKPSTSSSSRFWNCSFPRRMPISTGAGSASRSTRNCSKSLRKRKSGGGMSISWSRSG